MPAVVGDVCERANSVPTEVRSQKAKFKSQKRKNRNTKLISEFEDLNKSNWLI